MTELIESFGLIESVFEERAWRLKGICASTRPNRNGRNYPYPVLSKAVSDYQARISEGTSYGSLEHPKTAQGSAKDSAILITKMGFMNDDEVYMEATVLGTEDGKTIQAMLRAGGRVQFSTRGVGAINEDGTVQPGYQIFAVDVVMNASNPDARDVQAIFEDEAPMPATHAGGPMDGLDANPPGRKRKRRDDRLKGLKEESALAKILRQVEENRKRAKVPAVNTKPTLKGHDNMRGETPAAQSLRKKNTPVRIGETFLDEIPEDVFADFVSKNVELLHVAWDNYLQEAGLGTAIPPGYGRPAGLHQGEWKKPSKGAIFGGERPKSTAPSKNPVGNHPINEACRHLAECDVAHPMFGHALKLASKLHEASSTPSTYGGQKTTAKPQHDLASYGKSMSMAASRLKGNPDKGMFSAFKSLGTMVSKAHKEAMKATKESANGDQSRLAGVRREQKESIDFQMQRFDDLNKFNQKG
jgi:hypothetical protein